MKKYTSLIITTIACLFLVAVIFTTNMFLNGRQAECEDCQEMAELVERNRSLQNDFRYDLREAQEDVQVIVTGDIVAKVIQLVHDYTTDGRYNVAVLQQFQSRPFIAYMSEEIFESLTEGESYYFEIDSHLRRISQNQYLLGSVDMSYVLIENARPAREDELGLGFMGGVRYKRIE
jgi:hypothetical protein